MDITRETIKEYHKELDALLRTWAAEKGLSFEGGNISYNAREFAYRPKFVTKDENGQKTLDAWDLSAMMLTCKSLDYHNNPIGKTFLTYEGKRFTVTGYGDRKYCWEGILHGPRADRNVRVTSGYLLNLTKEVA